MLPRASMRGLVAQFSGADGRLHDWDWDVAFELSGHDIRSGRASYRFPLVYADRDAAASGPGVSDGVGS
jgi:hypothetical protein